MQRSVVWSAALLLIASPAATVAQSWDPIGDITHPDRIVRNVVRETESAVRDIPNLPRNVEREIGNAGAAIDRTRLEAMVQAGAPAFQVWLQESRNTAANGAQPIPPQIRQALTGYISEDLLTRARYKVGDPGVFNAANLSIQYGNAAAVTLIDVIVFKSSNDALTNPELWAHELTHVRQFQSWGVRDFAIRYLRSWNGVEGEAYEVQNDYPRWAAQRQQRFAMGPSIPGYSPMPQQAQVATMCVTNWGACSMAAMISVNSPCYCPSVNGPVWGVSR